MPAYAVCGATSWAPHRSGRLICSLGAEPCAYTTRCGRSRPLPRPFSSGPLRVAGVEIKYLVVPEVDPKKVSFSYQLFLDDFVRVYVTSDFRVWTSTIFSYFTPILNWCQVRGRDDCPESGYTHTVRPRPSQFCHGHGHGKENYEL